MTKAEERAWKKAEKAAQAERIKLLEETRAEVVTLLRQARDDITLVLAGAPTDYQQWHLTELQKEIDRVLGDLGQRSGNVLSTAAGKAWEGGVAAIDSQFSAVSIKAILPHLDTGQLMGIRAFMVDRIKDVSTVAASKIRQEIGLTMIGSQTIPEAIAKVAIHLGETSTSRASTIVRDNLSSAWAMASDERSQQSVEAGVEMDKIWRRSGKIHSRLAHDLADGRRIPINEAFMINGHKIRYPHDPKAPASEIINCGCICLYRPRNTPGTLPDKRPFSAEEIALNPNKAQIESGGTVSKLLGGK